MRTPMQCQNASEANFGYGDVEVIDCTETATLVITTPVDGGYYPDEKVLVCASCGKDDATARPLPAGHIVFYSPCGETRITFAPENRWNDVMGELQAVGAYAPDTWALVQAVGDVLDAGLDFDAPEAVEARDEAEAAAVRYRVEEERNEASWEAARAEERAAAQLATAGRRG